MATATPPTQPKRATLMRRQPSALARHALAAFADVRRYFDTDAHIAGALGWDVATAREWREQAVVRPQRVKVKQLLMLRGLCEDTRPFLREDLDVGHWLTSPQPHLRGHTPAQWLRGRGEHGLNELRRGLVEWMPKVSESDLTDLPAPGPLGEAQASGEFGRMLAELEG